MDISHITQDQWNYIAPMIMFIIMAMGLIYMIKQKVLNDTKWHPPERRVVTREGNYAACEHDIDSYTPQDRRPFLFSIFGTRNQMLCIERRFFRNRDCWCRCLAWSDDEGSVFFSFSKYSNMP